MYEPNGYGLYNMGGNVAEFVLPNTFDADGPEGLVDPFTRGGSFLDPPYYMQCDVRDFYEAGASAHVTRGFRPVIMVYDK